MISIFSLDQKVPDRKIQNFLTMSTKRVLVIDDEVDVRTVVQRCLEDLAGWEVMTAASGQEGLVQVVADPPDAILLDIMMPEMNGIDFLQALRTQPEGLSVPVVLLTAKVSLTQDSTFPPLDVEGIIHKPFDPFRLVEQISNFLGWTMEVYPPSVR